jgi:hypothetical protein
MIEVVHPLGRVVRAPVVFEQGCLRQVLAETFG